MTSAASLARQASAPEASGRSSHDRDRWQFLAETSLLLGEADDLEDVLATALRAVVPWFADLCVIRLSGHGTTPARVALARPELMGAFSRVAPRDAPRQDAGPLDSTPRFGSARLSELNDDALRRVARDDADFALWKELAPTTAITVPLNHRGRELGLVRFVTTRTSGLRYHPGDVPLARDIAQRLASAVDGTLRHGELRRSLASMRALQREAAHDLGDPLSTIYLALSDILDHPSAAISLSGRADRNIRIALRAAERMRGVIAGAVKGESPGDAVPMLPSTRLKVAPFLTALVDEYRVRARAAGIALRLSLAAALPSLTVDAESLGRALANLIGNAIKFTPRGGRVIVAAMVEAGALVLSVSDTGRGISDMDQLHIFEAQWRASADRPGSGLGLAIAKAKVEAMGGTIRCISQPGRGATFRVELRL
jgi:signal transduction histidine kinase